MSAVVAIAGLGVGAFTVAALAVGTRLLLLARRTRQTPELLIGSAFLLCGLGYVLIALPTLAPLEPLALVVAVLTTGRFAFAVGAGAVAVATWRIYRPAGLASLATIYALSLMLGAGFLNDLLVPLPDAYRTSRPLFWVGFAAGGLCFLWASLEALRYTALMRRRLAFGLADAGIMRRIRLWGIAAGCVAGNYLVAAVHLIWGTGPTTPPWLHVVVSSSALVAAVCVWRAFFPSGRRKALVSA